MNTEIQVASAALAEGDGDQSVTPAVGDQVEFTVSGKVTRVDGGMISVMPETINGSPAQAEPTEEESLDHEMNEMMKGGGTYA